MLVDTLKKPIQLTTKSGELPLCLYRSMVENPQSTGRIDIHPNHELAPCLYHCQGRDLNCKGYKPEYKELTTDRIVRYIDNLTRKLQLNQSKGLGRKLELEKFQRTLQRNLTRNQTHKQIDYSDYPFQ